MSSRTYTSRTTRTNEERDGPNPSNNRGNRGRGRGRSPNRGAANPRGARGEADRGARPLNRSVPLKQDTNNVLLGGSFQLGGSSGNPLEAAQEREQYNLAIREAKLREKEEARRRQVEEKERQEKLKEEQRQRSVQRKQEREMQQRQSHQAHVRKVWSEKSDSPIELDDYESEDEELRMAIEASLVETVNSATMSSDSDEEPLQDNRKGKDRYEPTNNNSKRELSEAEIIRNQQDREFVKALEQDKQKEKLQKEKEQNLKRQEKEREELEKRRKMLKDNLPPEPNPSDKTVLLKIRFRDGTTRQRRFLLSQTIRDLKDFIESIGAEITLSPLYEITSFNMTFHDKDPNTTLQVAGVGPPGQTLNVVEL